MEPGAAVAAHRESYREFFRFPGVLILKWRRHPGVVWNWRENIPSGYYAKIPSIPPRKVMQIGRQNHTLSRWWPRRVPPELDGEVEEEL